MITLTLILCLVGSDECVPFNIDASYASMEECRLAGDRLQAAHGDFLDLLGFEVPAQVVCREKAE